GVRRRQGTAAGGGGQRRRGVQPRQRPHRLLRADQQQEPRLDPPPTRKVIPGGDVAGTVGVFRLSHSIRPAGRTPLPSCLVAEYPRSSRARSASALRQCTTSGCWSATLVVSPGSLSRSNRASGVLSSP